jgi:hypothetical protein
MELGVFPYLRKTVDDIIAEKGHVLSSFRKLDEALHKLTALCFKSMFTVTAVYVILDDAAGTTPLRGRNETAGVGETRSDEDLSPFVTVLNELTRCSFLSVGGYSADKLWPRLFELFKARQPRWLDIHYTFCNVEHHTRIRWGHMFWLPGREALIESMERGECEMDRKNQDLLRSLNTHHVVADLAERIKLEGLLASSSIEIAQAVNRNFVEMSGSMKSNFDNLFQLCHCFLKCFSSGNPENQTLLFDCIPLDDPPKFEEFPVATFLSSLRDNLTVSKKLRPKHCQHYLNRLDVGELSVVLVEALSHMVSCVGVPLHQNQTLVFRQLELNSELLQILHAPILPGSEGSKAAHQRLRFHAALVQLVSSCMLDGPVEKKKVCQLLVPLPMIVDSMGKPSVPLYLQRAYLHFVDVMYIHNSQMAQFEPPDFCLSILLAVRRVFDAMEASSKRKAQTPRKLSVAPALPSQPVTPKDEVLVLGTPSDASGGILSGQGAEIAELRTARLEYCRLALDWLVSLYSTHVSYFHTTSDPLYEIIAALDTVAQATSLIFGTAECHEQALGDEGIGKLLRVLAPLFYIPALKALHITRQTLLEYQTTENQYRWLNEYLMHVWEVDKSESAEAIAKIARLSSLIFAMGTMNASSASQATGAEISPIVENVNPASRLQSMLTHTPIGANEEVDQALIDGLRFFQHEVMEHWHRSRREGVRQAAALKPVVVAKPVENVATMRLPMRVALYAKQLFQVRLQRLRPTLLVSENKFMFDVANPKSSFHSVVPTGPADPFEMQLADSTTKVLEEAVDAKVDVDKRTARPGFKVSGNATEVSFATLVHRLITTIGFYVMVIFPCTERLRWVLLRRWWETTKHTVSKWFQSVFRCFEQTDDEKEKFLSVPPPSIERPALLMPLADIELVLERLLMLMR